MFGREKARSRNRRKQSETSLWRHIAYGIGVCTFVALVTMSVWYVTRLPALTIVTIDIDGGETISHDAVRDTVARGLRGSYLKVIPFTFAFLYPHDALTASVASIPRVHEVTVNREGRTGIVVHFSEYVPYALWCTDSHDDHACYFLDATGYAFAQGPRLDGGSLVRHVKEGESELDKKQAFDTKSFMAIQAFLERLTNELGFRVTDVFYTKEGDIRLHVNGGGEFIMRSDVSFDTIFNNLASILSAPSFKKLQPGNFGYIDLRFGNKVFVHEGKGDEATSTATSTVATST